MKNHLYYLCLLLGLVFGVITLTACGDDDENTASSKDAADRDAFGNLKVSAINFPDENFRSFLLSQEYGVDGVLTEKEIAEIKSMEIPSLKIQSLNGIAFFTSLVELDCEHNLITSLDMSKNVKLTKLACHSNQLTSLDVSKNIALKELHCENNRLTSLDVSNNTKLTELSYDTDKVTIYGWPK